MRTLFSSITLLLCALVMAACPMDGPSPVAISCRQAGGEVESRPHPDRPGALTDYCRFSEEEGCYGEQVRDGVCIPPGWHVPISPLIPLDASAPLPYSEWMTTPVTLAALVSVAPLIVIGEVGPVARYHDYVEYGPDGALVERGEDRAGYPVPDRPATDFAIVVEEVLRDEGAVAAGEPIILRMAGVMTKPLQERTRKSEYPYSTTGDRHLFLLTPNPDGQSYGLAYGPWSRLLMDTTDAQNDGVLRVSNGEQSPLQFGGDSSSDAPITLAAFIQFVQAQ